MANKKLENQELRKQVKDLEQRVESLEIRNKSLVEQHIADAHKMNDLLTNQEAALQEIETIYQSHMTDLVEMFGEEVKEDDGTVIGKRIEFFPAEKLNTHKFEADVKVEDEKAKVILGITYSEEEGSSYETGNASKKNEG